MTVPPLPPAKNTTDFVDNAYVDAIRALQAYFRDGRPFLHIRNDTGSSSPFLGTSIATSSDTELEIGTGADGLFHETPVINIGGWEGGYSGEEGAIVPDDGVYWLLAWAQFEADTSGVRRLWLLDTGSEIPYTRIAQAPTGSASIATSLIAMGPRRLTAGDEINAVVNQNSGSTLTVAAALTAVWLMA